MSIEQFMSIKDAADQVADALIHGEKPTSNYETFPDYRCDRQFLGKYNLIFTNKYAILEDKSYNIVVVPNDIDISTQRGGYFNIIFCTNSGENVLIRASESSINMLANLSWRFMRADRLPKYIRMTAKTFMPNVKDIIIRKNDTILLVSELYDIVFIDRRAIAMDYVDVLSNTPNLHIRIYTDRISLIGDNNVYSVRQPLALKHVNKSFGELRKLVIHH